MSKRNVWTIFIVVIAVVCIIGVCAASAVGAVVYLSPASRVSIESDYRRSDNQNALRLYAQEPVTLDPALAGDANSTEIINKIFNGLVSLNQDMEVTPELAESWEVSEDGLTYIFRLRENIKFQDGTPITARDFKYSIERATDPKTGSRVASSYMQDIVGAIDKLTGKADQVRGYEVIDDRTIRITLDQPRAYFLSKLTYHTFDVLDRRNVEQGSQPWWLRPNGSGPFSLERIDKDEIVLRANKNYVFGEPPISTVHFTLRGGSPMTMYEQGELDAVIVPSSHIEQVLDSTNPLSADLVVVPSLDVWYLAFDTQQSPFDDAKVRQAFAHATNKEGIAKVLLQKTVIPAKGILPPEMPGYNENLQGLAYDPDLAKQRLAESSYGDASKLPPIVFGISGTGDTDPLAAALTEMYADILGVDIEINQVSWDAFQEDLYNHVFQMFMLGWVADYPDPEDFLDVLFHSKSEQNHARYRNPQLDAILEQARGEADHDKRMDLYRQAEEIIVQDAPWVPIYHGINYVLVKPYLEGLTVTPQGEYHLTEARFVDSY
mgnify:FL=1